MITFMVIVGVTVGQAENISSKRAYTQFKTASAKIEAINSEYDARVKQLGSFALGVARDRAADTQMSFVDNWSRSLVKALSRGDTEEAEKIRKYRANTLEKAKAYKNGDMDDELKAEWVGQVALINLERDQKLKPHLRAIEAAYEIEQKDIESLCITFQNEYNAKEMAAEMARKYNQALILYKKDGNKDKLMASYKEKKDADIDLQIATDDVKEKTKFFRR